MVRYQAAAELGALAIRLLFQPLIATLGDRDWEVRYCAAEALGKVKDTAAVEPLIGVLKSDKDASVRRQAAQSLGEIGDPPHGAFLAALNDSDEFVRNVSGAAWPKLANLLSNRLLVR